MSSKTSLNRRQLLALAGATPFATSAGLGACANASFAPGTDVTKHAGHKDPNESQYFAAVSKALKRAGLYRPTMVIDRDRLTANINTVQSKIAPGMHYRAVTKSLPSSGLIDFVLKQANTRRLMAFHQPFINTAAANWPDSEILVGKPMPVGAAAEFYRAHKPSSFNPSQQIQWLIDTPHRLNQYRDFAEATDQTLLVSLELDVGFHRGGIATAEDLAACLEILSQSQRLKLAGMMGYDGHVSLFPDLVGPPETSIPMTSAKFDAAIAQARSTLTDLDTEALTLNTAGSTTYMHYASGQQYTPANDISVGSGLVKPLFCDKTQPDHLAAAFIASPVLKRNEKVRVPGLLDDPKGGAQDDLDRDQTIFIYGGRWMADPHYPEGLAPHPIYGRSSNQDMFTLPASINIAPDDFVFLRPRQSEAVLLQFGDLAIYSQGEIIDFWPLLETA
ncbi:MAG: DSD1 family PLP-dependent enzyme [Henriciella sp.]